MRFVRTPEKVDKERFVDFGDDPAADGYLEIYLKVSFLKYSEPRAGANILATFPE
jgi:hypothetical protein